MTAEVLKRGLFGKSYSVPPLLELLVDGKGRGVISFLRGRHSRRRLAALFLSCGTLEAITDGSIDPYTTKGLPTTNSLLIHVIAGAGVCAYAFYNLRCHGSLCFSPLETRKILSSRERWSFRHNALSKLSPQSLAF